VPDELLDALLGTRPRLVGRFAVREAAEKRFLEGYAPEAAGEDVPGRAEAATVVPR
jgi:hypothetical protein